jgi:hypothetical protein
MTVEMYSDKYFLDVVTLVENFHKEAVVEYDNLFDANTIIETIKTNKDSGNAFLLIIDGTCQGIIFGMIAKSMLNGKLMFQEIIWYVNKPYRKYGVRLLKHVENMLQLKGVSIIIMALLENSKAEKLKVFYERLGYKPMETHFVRAL